MAQFEKKPVSFADRPLKRLWHEVYHIGSFAAGFAGVFFLYSKLAPFPSALATRTLNAARRGTGITYVL